MGYVVLAHINRAETPFMYERDYLDIDEIGVDKDLEGMEWLVRLFLTFLIMQKIKALKECS